MLLLAFPSGTNYYYFTMTAPDRFGHYDSQEVDPFEIMDEYEAFQRERQQEFSKKIGHRAIKLVLAFGIASKSRFVEWGMGYSVATTLVQSKEKELDSGACARLSFKRESTGIWAPAEVRLGIGRLTRTGIGPITEVELDYIDEEESRTRVGLSSYMYAQAFPFHSALQEISHSDAKRSTATFLQTLETIEQQAFPR